MKINQQVTIWEEADMRCLWIRQCTSICLHKFREPQKSLRKFIRPEQCTVYLWINLHTTCIVRCGGGVTNHHMVNVTLNCNVSAMSYIECVKFWDTLQWPSSRWVKWRVGELRYGSHGVSDTWCYVMGRSHVNWKKISRKIGTARYKVSQVCLYIVCSNQQVPLKQHDSSTTLHSATCHKNCKITAVRTLILTYEYQFLAKFWPEIQMQITISTVLW